MPVTDYLLNSLVKYLQKKQKKREREKKKAKKAARKRKTKKTKKPFFSKAKHKTKPAKKKLVKRPSKKKSKKPTSHRKKQVPRPKKKKAPRKIPKKVKKSPKKKTIKPVKETKEANEIRVGEVSHFFSGIKVIVLKVTNGKLLIGDKIHLKGRSTDFVQQVKSLQIESVDVKVASKGQLVGLKVSKKAKEGDQVFKVG